MQINCAKLGDEIKLSDYIRNENEDVNVTNLRPGQTFIVDVSLDGEYEYPDNPKVAKWVSPDGTREGVHSSLLKFSDSDGFTLNFADGVETRNSRGRGITFDRCRNYTANDVWVRGARTAGISHHNCNSFTLVRPTTIDTSNYQTSRRDVNRWNVSGSIKFVSCHDYKVVRPTSVDHMGNGITATESIAGTWTDGIAIDVSGAVYYVNASPNHSLYNCIQSGDNNAYVVNSEEENEGISDGVSFDYCYALDCKKGLGFWGNEGKQGLAIEQAAATNNLFVYTDTDIEIKRNSVVRNLDTAGTLAFKPNEVDSNLLTAMREQSTALKAVILRHGTNDEIDANAQRLRDLFAQLRPVPVIVQPVEPLYTHGQRLWIVADVDNIDKAQRVIAGAGIAGLTVQAVGTNDPTVALVERVRAALEN